MSILPHYFGDTGRELFGVYHPPEGSTARPSGVVLCYPALQEYRVAHWAFRKLATLLAKEGFHVLRFDYYGTGDSAGTSSAGSVAQWVSDIAAASSQLKDLGGIRRVSLVGMRLGASLAALACAEGLAVKDMVLWEPVLSGRDHLAQLEAVQTRTLFELHSPQDDEPSEGTLLGFPLSMDLRADISSIDLLAGALFRPDRVLLIVSEARNEYQVLADRVESAGVNTTLRVVDDPLLWGGSDSISDTLFAHNVPLAIAAFLVRRAS